MIGKLTESSQLIGNISMGGSSVEYEAGTGIDITDNVISNTITSYNDLSDTPTLSNVATSGSYNDLQDKPTIPTLPQTITESTTFTYKNQTFNLDMNKYGNVVSIQIHTDVFNKTNTGYDITLLTTIPEGWRPDFEVCADILYFGLDKGTAWIQPNGEVYIKLGYSGSFDLFRLNFTYIMPNAN